MNFHRQLDVLDVPRLARTPITVIGAGAVGSFTVVALAKSGAEYITGWDDDSVESHNSGNWCHNWCRYFCSNRAGCGTICRTSYRYLFSDFRIGVFVCWIMLCRICLDDPNFGECLHLCILHSWRVYSMDYRVGPDS